MSVEGVRINIIGASGSGCSTLARALATRLQVPVFDSDDYYHKPTDPPFQEPFSGEERFQRITAALSRAESWTLAGGIFHWRPRPLPGITHTIFLTAPWEVLESRLRRRERERFCCRIDPGGDMHETHKEFIQWASRYDAGDIEGKTLRLHEEYLESLATPVLRGSGTSEPTALVERVMTSFGI